MTADDILAMLNEGCVMRGGTMWKVGSKHQKERIGAVENYALVRLVMGMIVEAMDSGKEQKAPITGFGREFAITVKRVRKPEPAAKSKAKR